MNLIATATAALDGGAQLIADAISGIPTPDLSALQQIADALNATGPTQSFDTSFVDELIRYLRDNYAFDSGGAQLLLSSTPATPTS